MKKIPISAILWLFFLTSCNLFDSGPHINCEKEETAVSFVELNRSPGVPLPGGHDGVSLCRPNWKNIELRSRMSDFGPEELSDVELIITEQEDFDRYIICNDGAPEIDLDEYFLLVGVTRGMPHWIHVKEQNVYLSCDTLSYRIEITAGTATMGVRGSYMVMLKREYSGHPVTFNVFWGSRSNLE